MAQAFLAGAIAVFGGLAAPVTAAIAPSPTVLNEMVTGIYIEIYNGSSSTVDVSGYQMLFCDEDGVAVTLRISLGARLPPGGFYLIAAAGYTGGPADQTYPDWLPGAGAVLLDRSYGWIDGVAVVAGSPCGQGAPAPACPGEATARVDQVGDNAADFVCLPPTPEESNEDTYTQPRRAA